MKPLAIIYAFTMIIFFGVIMITDYMKSKHLRWRFSGVAFKYSLALTLMSITSSLWMVYITEDGPAFLTNVASGLLQWPLLYIYISVGVRYAKKRLELPGALFWKKNYRFILFRKTKIMTE